MAGQKKRNEPKGRRRIKVTDDFHEYWNRMARNLDTDSAGVSDILLPRLKKMGRAKMELIFENDKKKKKKSNVEDYFNI